MGILSDFNNQETNIESNPVVIKSTRNGALIVCPRCKGDKTETITYDDYAGREDIVLCERCNGGGVVRLRVIEKRRRKK